MALLGSAPAPEPPLSVALVGFGRIMREDHFPAVLSSTEVVLDCVCDPDLGALENLPADIQVPTFGTVEEMLSERRPDAAIAAVPHHQYVPTLRALAEAGVHVLKEKPLAVSLDEAREIDELVRSSGIRLMITLQRRFNPIFRCFEQFRHHIGRVFHFEARYTLNVPALDLGWRSEASAAGGGCLIDMGYHTVDLLLWYFGLPGSVQAVATTGSREHQKYDVEDTASLVMQYDASHGQSGPVFGTAFVSRVFPRKQEELTVVGTRGLIEVDRLSIKRVSAGGDVMEELSRSGEWPSSYLDQLNSFVAWVRNDAAVPEPSYRQHFAHVALIEAAYASAAAGHPVRPGDLLAEHGLSEFV